RRESSEQPFARGRLRAAGLRPGPPLRRRAPPIFGHPLALELPSPAELPLRPLLLRENGAMPRDSSHFGGWREIFYRKIFADHFFVVLLQTVKMSETIKRI
ncbi:hypothetical protein, partial [uncultured Alistipes sp.]|uniref:hypothetical protein n=1 Tax=uncultured Alistipes sp. TaxID=538949 RepID=UPI0026299E1F